MPPFVPPSVQARNATLGLVVSRPQTASGNSPLTTGGLNLFTVSGGRILVKAIIGQVTTQIQAQATTVKFTSSPTTGTATDLSGATTDLTGAEVGALFGLAVAGPGAANQVQLVKSGYLVVPQTNAVVIPIGNISVTYGAASTGAVKYDLVWTALDAGSSVVATA